MGSLRLLALPFLLLATPALGDAQFDPAHLVDVELVSESAVVNPGEALPIALQFKIAPGWHIYWENPGDSGQATRATFSGPEGSTFSSLTFPGPKRFDLAGGIKNFGYDDKAALFAEAKVPEGYTGETVDLQAEVKWLVCHDRCIPQSKTVSLTLPVAKTPKANDEATAALAPFRAKLPKSFASQSMLSWGWQEGDVLKLRAPEGAKLTFFPSPDVPYGAGSVKTLSGGRTALISFPGGAAPGGTIGVEQGGVVSYFQLVPSDVPR